ncbi:sensor domain-containing diguanylate cyclase [Kangiella marina]|uniref:Sensor domain-containing diguanylate cyclase n=1 Tax=Kangiella marina TaxID=1079178 RepID=A0ABP8IB64_9GAMM
MKKPPMTTNEESRLITLCSLNLLDTKPEERFDRITRLAKRLFGTKTALITLVDRDRQWFKSRFGLSVSETPRDISFCAHVIHDDGTMVIRDTLEDERFVDNPLVTNEPFIRFYAGHPLVHPDGQKIGTLCITDDEPRDFTDEDIASLQDLAALASRELTATTMETIDELTKISNRRGFKSLSQNSLNFCKRNQLDAALCFIDLNDFKLINDNYGHAEGDKALIMFAQTMIDTFRNTDVFARIGGDEFVILMTDTKADEAESIMQRFKSSITEKNDANPKGYRVKFSWGLVSVPHDGTHDINELLNKADALMYQDKRDTRME